MLKEGTLNLESAAKSNKLDVAYIERVRCRNATGL